jgi:putative transposase
MNYVIKTKIRSPNKELLEKLEFNAFMARFTYNWLLGFCLSSKCNPKEARNVFRRLLKENKLFNTKNGTFYDDDFQILLRSGPSQITDMESDNLIQAFKNVKKKKIPSFKDRYKGIQSFMLNKKNDSNFKLDNNILKVVKIGDIKINLDKLRINLPDYNIKRITFTKSSYGWYVCILIDIEEDYFLKKKKKKKIGIDWGVKAFASDSNGKQFKFKEFESYKNYIKLYKELKRLQSILSKKRNNNKEWKKSKKYQKLKEKVAYLYEKLTNKRKDFLHYVSKYYINKYGTIVIEDLKPCNMLKNHKLARVISEGMFYTWKVMLQYKSKFYGRELIIINPTNTSQTCSVCGTKLSKKLKLNERIFKCDKCNHEEDRDINAAKNILKLAC